MPLPSIDEIEGILSARRPEAQAGYGYHRAAVLIPLVGREETGEYDFLLTLRTDSVEHHKGQVSFPGGATDSTDRDSIATALREAAEEVGIVPETVRILGVLNNLHTPTGFLITPVVGFLPARPHLTLERGEVAEAFYVPVSFFADAANATMELRDIEGTSREVFFYHYGEFTIWGITALIIRNLIGMLERTHLRQ